MSLLLLILVRLEEWLREDTKDGSMPRIVDSLGVGGEVAGDFTGGLGPH